MQNLEIKNLLAALEALCTSSKEIEDALDLEGDEAFKHLVEKRVELLAEARARIENTPAEILAREPLLSKLRRAVQAENGMYSRLHLEREQINANLNEVSDTRSNLKQLSLSYGMPQSSRSVSMNA